MEVQFPLWVISKEKAETVIRSLYYIYRKIAGWKKTRTYSTAAAQPKKSSLTSPSHLQLPYSITVTIFWKVSWRYKDSTIYAHQCQLSLELKKRAGASQDPNFWFPVIHTHILPQRQILCSQAKSWEGTLPWTHHPSSRLWTRNAQQRLTKCKFSTGGGLMPHRLLNP